MCRIASFAVVALLMSFNAHSIVVDFIGPCEKAPFTSVEIAFHHQSVGRASIEALAKLNLQYEGTDQGINSIEDSPTGNDALEMLGDGSMRAYGWCYKVDGFEPDLYPDQMMILDGKAHIVWFFGYALYEGGRWITQCTPSYETASAFVCPK